MRRIVLLIGLLAALGAIAAGCGGDEGEDDDAAAPATTGAVAEEPDPCAREELTLVNEDQLTIGTDNPAFPPWFEGGTPDGSEWEINDPATGEGFESAVAYAVAEQLGFSEDEVEWAVVPFNLSFRPGPKDFDFDINQISYVEERDGAVDFSDSYYDVNQAVVTLQSSDFADAASIEELQGAKLGAPVGTTSYDYIVENIQPGEDPAVYDRLDDAVSGLQNRQVDGIVVDLPTAFFITAVQVPEGTIVGQFPSAGGQEYFGMVFEEGNPLRDCVNEALTALSEDGTLDSIQQEWLADKTDAPVLE